jgi:hypothetical protein
MSNSPVIDTVGTPVVDPPAVDPAAPQTSSASLPTVAPMPLSGVQQLTVADIVAKIHGVLMADEEGYSLTREQVNRIEQLGQIQVGDVTWVTGKTSPGNEAFHVLAMYQGASNEQVADHMQGDVRAYLIPRTVVAPGAREYRRYTFNLLMNKTLTHRMTLEQFVEAVAYEELTVATDLGIVEPEEEEEEDPS